MRVGKTLNDCQARKFWMRSAGLGKLPLGIRKLHEQLELLF
jgi:hypothetical protein